MNPETVSRSRKVVTKKLPSGQKISLSPQDEKTLKSVYDYLAGFATRKLIESHIDLKKLEVSHFNNQIPTSVKLMLQQNGINYQEYIPASLGKSDIDSEEEKSENDLKLDKYYQAKSELSDLEFNLKVHLHADHKICFKDLEGAMKSLNTSVHKREIEQMIWEADESMDGVIDFDELQLTYFRNLSDSSGHEPNSLYRLVEFLMFDVNRLGYIVENDCMERLYARFGGSNLEKEMRLLFGTSLEAEGGDGRLNFESYLKSCVARSGRRALIC